MSLLHILFAPRAEGCPRLALDLIDQEHYQTGGRAHVAFLVEEPDDLSSDFADRCESLHMLDWRPRGFAQLYFRTRRVLSQIRPDGIVCYTLGHHVPISIAARSLGIPVVVHVGNAPPSNDADRRKVRRFLKIGSPFVQMHIACSDVIAADCRETYGLARVESIPNGIDISRFVPLRDRPHAPMAPIAPGLKGRVLGMIASLAPHKDHTVLIEAMSILKRRGIDDKLLLAGAGSESERLRRLAVELDVMDRIEWLGNINDVGTVLSSLDVFVFATTRSEGLGIALVEAMAAGVPVVASDVPACREVLEGGRWGRLVARRDAETWADALTSIESIPIPPIHTLSRYDIRQTWRAYAKAIGI